MKSLKLICVVLSAAALLAFAGIAEALAVEWLSSVTVYDLKEPSVGAHPDYVFKTAELTGFICDMPGPGGEWLESADGISYEVMPYDTDDSDSPVFKVGYYYKYRTAFLSQGGYRWEMLNFKVTVNGSDELSYSIVGDRLTVEKDFGLLARKEIASVSVTDLDMPEIGKKPDTDFVLENGEGITAESFGWYESADGENYTLMNNAHGGAEGPLFKAERFYRFSAVLSADPDHVFAAPEKMTGKVGGLPAKYEIADDRLVVSADFQKLENEHIYQIEILGVTAPEIGAKPDFTYSISDGSRSVPNYDPGEGFWLESFDGGATFNFMDRDSVFKEGCKYRFMAETAPETGYEYDRSFSVYVNGNKANAMLLLSETREDVMIAVISYTYSRLVNYGVVITPDNGLDEFNTYEADAPITAGVVITGAPEDAEVSWYLCNAIGDTADDVQVGSGKSAVLPGIPAEDMMVDHFVKVIVTDALDGAALGAAVIPYKLLPVGVEEPDPVTVFLRDWESVVVAGEGELSTFVEAVTEGASGDVAVYWYRADAKGSVDYGSPFAEGTTAELSGGSSDEKVLYYEVRAVDSRGESYAGSFRFSYVPYRVRETSTPEPGSEETPEPQETPDIEPTSAPTPGPSENEGRDEGGKNGGMSKPLLIILAASGAAAACAAFAVLGFLLGKRRKNRYR